MLQQLMDCNNKQEKQAPKSLKSSVIISYNQKGKKIFTFPEFLQYPFSIDPQYQLDTVKGLGTYALVASGKNTQNDEQVAIKRIHKVFDQLGDTKRILRQIKILKFLKHKNIVGLKDMMKIQKQEINKYNQVYLCMEYMDYTLQRLIHSQQVPLNQKMMQFILYQLFSAINYMHSADIIHRDIKPENILINKKLELKIADMNLARKQIATEEVTYYVASRPYRAPEIFINHNIYSKAIDIWSIGCIFAEMLGKTVLFKGKDYIDQLRRFVAILGKPKLELFPGLDPIQLQGLNRVFKDIPDRDKVDWKFLFPKASPQALDLLDHILVYDPQLRYNAEQCLNHPFLEEYKNRARVKCKDVFDFSFDKIEMTEQNLRKAIYQQAEIFQQKKRRNQEPTSVNQSTQIQQSIRKPEPINEHESMGKKIKRQ